jgi:hypothetical protein
MKRIKQKNKVSFNGKTVTSELDVFASKGHTDYSGYGYHEDKTRKAERRSRKMQEKRARLGFDD